MAGDPDPDPHPNQAQRPRRRRRTRAETEADLLAAARESLRRDGVLAGVNLREIAIEAGVNHGQIYQYYGDRRTLLRAAVAELVALDSEGREAHWEHPFAERRADMLRYRIAEPELVRLAALLALDGDEDFSALPFFAQTRHGLERDAEQGALAPEVDAVAAHVLASAAEMGYAIFREVFARDTGLPLEELDARITQMHARVIETLAGPGKDAESRGGD